MGRHCCSFEPIVHAPPCTKTITGAPSTPPLGVITSSRCARVAVVVVGEIAARCETAAVDGGPRAASATTRASPAVAPSVGSTSSAPRVGAAHRLTTAGRAQLARDEQRAVGERPSRRRERGRDAAKRARAATRSRADDRDGDERDGEQLARELAGQRSRP